MNDLNIHLFRLINNLGLNYPFFNPFFIFFANYSVPILALFLLYNWFIKDNHKPVILGSLIFVSGDIIARNILGNLHFNYQPFFILENVNQLIEKELNNSFPSNHTILAFSFMLAFMYFSHKRLHKFLFLSIGLLMSVSRIGVGVHYPLDVLVSILLSISLLVLFLFLDKKFKIINIILSIYYLCYNKVLNKIKNSKI